MYFLLFFPCWVGCLKPVLSMNIIYRNNFCFYKIFKNIIFDSKEVK